MSRRSLVVALVLLIAVVALVGIYLEWPSGNGVLKKIKLDGGDIFTTQTVPPAVTVTSGWHDDASRRRIEATIWGRRLEPTCGRASIRIEGSAP